ncbi:MAG: hypothetical protein ACI4TT_01780 [Christensenellales bacterium]
MEEVCRKLSNNFLNEFNKKLEMNEIKDFFDYAKSFYEDLCVVDKYYKEEFNSKSPLSINRYIISFDNAYNSIIQTIFDEDIKKQIKDDKTQYMIKCGRFNLDNLIKKYNINKGFENDFKHKYLDKADFNKINDLANVIFKLELKCSKYTKTFWNFCDNIDLKQGLFVKIITQENWRELKPTLSLKKYYNSRIGLSVSYINDKKSKFFRDDQMEILAGIVYKPQEVLFGNYFDSYTSEFINGKNPIDNLNFSFSKVNKLYSKKMNGKLHEIYAFGTLTSTPKSVLISDDCHNEVVIDKDSAKPLAVFYLNEQSKQYAQELAQKFNLEIIKLESMNKLSPDKIVNTEHILQEKIHF